LGVKRCKMRKPFGITIPYREVGYKEDAMKVLEEKVKALEKRIEQLEKQRKEK
jgi:polyhydroxyalkanoate synthesis regulator phasin